VTGRAGRVSWLWVRDIGPFYGWGWLMAALLMFSGTQLVLLGLIGEYIGRMFLTVNQAAAGGGADGRARSVARGRGLILTGRWPRTWRGKLNGRHHRVAIPASSAP
jgi:hypothetical protein